MNKANKSSAASQVPWEVVNRLPSIEPFKVFVGSLTKRNPTEKSLSSLSQELLLWIRFGMTVQGARVTWLAHIFYHNTLPLIARKAQAYDTHPT